MNNLIQLLGLAKRANKLISGESLVLSEIRAKRAYVIIMTIDAAPNLKKKITDKCRTYQIPLIQYGTRNELGKAIGKEERVVLAITDPGLAKIMIEASFKT